MLERAFPVSSRCRPGRRGWRRGLGRGDGAFSGFGGAVPAGDEPGKCRSRVRWGRRAVGLAQEGRAVCWPVSRRAWGWGDGTSPAMTARAHWTSRCG